MADPISVTIDDPGNSVRVDPVTGTIETDQEDGGVVVQLDAHRPSQDAAEPEEWFRNLANDCDPARLSVIANDLLEGIRADDSSRAGYLDTVSRGMDLLGTELKKPGSSVGDSTEGIEGISKVTNPMLLDALLRGWANAQAELLPADGPMKVTVRNDDSEQQNALAESLERDMNYWFTEVAGEYYPDTSHMLLWGTYFKGSGFKKVYRCAMRRRPVSESVDAKDLIVSDTTKDLRSCGRITHQITMRPSVMKRMQLIGAYRDVELTQPTTATNEVDEKIAAQQGTQSSPSRPEDKPYNLYETQCELDLDDFIPQGSQFKGEGIPLPYLVVIDKDSQQILQLRRDWNEWDEHAERRRQYVRYGYVPGPGFYGTGLLNILGNSTAAMTAAWREALDAGMFASFPGGMISKSSARQQTSNFRMGLGEFATIETNGMPISNVVMPMPYRDATAGLLSLIDKITAQCASLGGAADIPAAEGIQNVPVGTMMAQIEQATKVMAAAHKGMHQSQSEELDLIVNLFRENPQDFWVTNRSCPPGYWDEAKFLQAISDCQLAPKSDPNVPSHLHRVMKALALVQLIAIPQFTPIMNAKEALLRCLRIIREDPGGLVQDAPETAGQEDLTGKAKIMEAQVREKKLGIDAGIAASKEKTEMAKMASDERIVGVEYQKELITQAEDAEKAKQQTALQMRKQMHDEQCFDDDMQTDQRKHAVETDRARESETLDRLLEMAKMTGEARKHAIDTGMQKREQDIEEKRVKVEEYAAKHPPKPARPAGKK